MSAAPRPRRDPEAAAKIARERVAALRPLCRPASTEHAYLTSHCVSPTATLFEVDRAVACKHLRSHLPSQAGNLTGDVLLVVCMFHLGELASAQLIDAEGRKHFVAGAPTTGAYWSTEDLVGREWDAQLVLVVTEGMAKALAVAAAMPGAIGVAAMSAGNMQATAEDLRARFPDARIIIFGDRGNGEKQARDAALAVDGDLALPDLDGSPGAKDANDQIRLKGIASLTATLAAAKKPEAVAIDAEVMPPGDRRNPRDYPLTEQGAAELFAALNRGSLVYVPQWKSWLEWTGTHWERDVGNVSALARTKAISAAFLADAQWAAKNDDVRAAALAKFAARLQQLKVRENVLGGAKAEAGMAKPSSIFDASHDLLNFGNGTYELGAHRFRDHRRDDYQTATLGYDYQEGARSSLWERVVADVWPDVDTQRFFRRWTGYCLTGSVSEQKFVILWGTGANGKSVIVETLLALLGSYARKVSSTVFARNEHDDPERKVIPLRKKRLVLTAETQMGQSLDEDMIKAIVSIDRQSSRQLYCESEEWEPTAKVIIMGNHRPRTRGGDFATDRRIIFVGCEQKFVGERCDLDLVDKLKGELPGIMNWAIQGHREWAESRARREPNALGIPTAVATTTREFCEENDALAPFFDALAVDQPVFRADLYQRYRAWSGAQGNEHHLSPQSFAAQARMHGLRPGPKQRVGERTDRTWLPASCSTVPPCGTSPRKSTIETIQEEVPGRTATDCHTATDADPIDPLAVLDHVLRTRHGTTATDADRQALAEHFARLNGQSEAAGERLWDFWKADPAPTVAAFLEREKRTAKGAR